MTANRRASLSRATSESKVDLTLDLDGTGESEISHRCAVLRPHAHGLSRSTR